MGRPGTARNSNGPDRPEIQTIRAFSGLGRAGPGGPNVHLYIGHDWMIVVGDFICMLLEHLGIRGRNAHIV
jgi:hypothetical protein